MSIWFQKRTAKIVSRVPLGDRCRLEIHEYDPKNYRDFFAGQGARAMATWHIGEFPRAQATQAFLPLLHAIEEYHGPLDEADVEELRQSVVEKIEPAGGDAIYSDVAVAHAAA